MPPLDDALRDLRRVRASGLEPPQRVVEGDTAAADVGGHPGGLLRVARGPERFEDGVDIFPFRDGLILRKDVYSSAHNPRVLV